MTKEAEIRQLLIQGTTKADLVRQGYARGTVYKVGRRLARETVPSQLSNGTDPRPESLVFPITQSTDPEIAQLQREIQKAKLESDLSKIKGHVKSVEQLQRELSHLQEWTVSMVRSLGESIQLLSGNKVDNQTYEVFEREALREMRGH